MFRSFKEIFVIVGYFPLGVDSLAGVEGFAGILNDASI